MLNIHVSDHAAVMLIYHLTSLNITPPCLYLADKHLSALLIKLCKKKKKKSSSSLFLMFRMCAQTAAGREKKQKKTHSERDLGCMGQCKVEIRNKRSFSFKYNDTSER